MLGLCNRTLSGQLGNQTQSDQSLLLAFFFSPNEFFSVALADGLSLESES